MFFFIFLIHFGTENMFKNTEKLKKSITNNSAVLDISQLKRIQKTEDIITVIENLVLLKAGATDDTWVEIAKICHYHQDALYAAGRTRTKLYKRVTRVLNEILLMHLTSS